MRLLLHRVALLVVCLLFFIAPRAIAAADDAHFYKITRIWLTHRSASPEKVVINWTSNQPGESIVCFGSTEECQNQVKIAGKRTLHHVEIPVDQQATHCFYSVQTGQETSEKAALKTIPREVLRVAIVADWQSQPDLTALLADEPHLLLSAGDNIVNLWQDCGAGKPACYRPYEKLIDAYPRLFQTIPFLPVLGNHDREMRPRGPQPPAEHVYDVEATAFREFFELPGEEWKWAFEVPEFGLRLLALDFNHISDFGTTWQTCHPFQIDSAQFRWYEQQMQQPAPFVITLYNERNATMRSQAAGRWLELFRKGTACVTGFGYFAERAEVDGFPFYNTSLSGKGSKYPDPHSRFLASEDSYLMVTLDRNKPEQMLVEIKSLAGKVLDRQTYTATGR